MPKPLTQVQLDQVNECGNPHCDHKHDMDEIFLRPSCCEGAFLEVCYVKASGTLRFTCTTCGSLMSLIMVAAA